MSQNQASTLKAARLIDQVDPKRKSKIWYNENEPLGPVFRQINAVSYLNNGNNRVTKSFPDVVEGIQPLGSEGSTLVRGDQILVLSSKPGDVKTLFNVLDKINLHADLLSTHVLEFNQEFDIYFWFVLVD
jgi:hypothetical protein